MDQAKIFELTNRVRQVQGQQLNEAMTKNSLVMPFIQALGYDVFDPNEVVAEFTADVGTKKGEKVDFAIMRDGLPAIMIECKPMGMPLDGGKCNQLHRYFPTHTTTRIGILTDGVTYLFFSDLEQQNIMDSRPFMKVDFGNFNDRLLPEIQKLSKDMWDLEAALSSASSLKYVSEAKKLFAQESASPSEDFVKYFASRIYDGHVTAKVREQFSSIVKRAIQEHINDLINSRLESAKVDDIPKKDDATEQQIDSDGTGIETTDDEAVAFLIIKTILRQAISPSRIFIRDAKSYCAIVLDDNNRKTICRLYFNGKKKSVGIFDAAKKEERVAIENEDDLFACGDKLLAALQTFLTGEQG
ncbi:type I restriction endonuclease [Solidesulfovibrio alcoholivorans]|uniref:type I restriction endonuclease n=1 Tax=Solidesulfovibrio alcoholivorans TaxID=81406 RepID=UPI000497589B|nr:type I restriction endonuclease [Solidesulfovibrio alcoholivorans]